MLLDLVLHKLEKGKTRLILIGDSANIQGGELDELVTNSTVLVGHSVRIL